MPGVDHSIAPVDVPSAPATASGRVAAALLVNEVADQQVSVALLRASFRHLVARSGFLDTQSEKGFLACQTFLKALEICSEAMRLEPAARSYRNHFSRKFRDLFEGHGRSYRVDVLEAGTSRGLVVWANGERVQLSQLLSADAEALREAWISLGSFLSQWDRSRAERHREAPDSLLLDELRAGLARFDFAWATFECAYIAELMRLQERGRLLLCKAVKYEHRLRAFESSGGDENGLLGLPEYQTLQHKLISYIERMNSLANVRRKGRHRLTSDTLAAALKILEPRCQGCPARVLAEGVVASYAKMREYIYEAGKRLEEVDPDLWRNVELADRLECWEESWEIGVRYLQEPRQFHATCDVVVCLQEVVKAAPALARMCEDRDPELFLALPRAVLLAFLASPHGPRAALLRRLLPHRFQPRGEAAEPAGPCAELLGLAERFEGLRRLLWRQGVSEGAAWRLVLRRAVCGVGSSAGQAGDPASAEAEEAMGDFIRELEGWSMELQRTTAHGRTPEDWNECSDVLVRCLLSTLPSRDPSPGQRKSTADTGSC